MFSTQLLFHISQDDNQADEVGSHTTESLLQGVVVHIQTLPKFFCKTIGLHQP